MSTWFAASRQGKQPINALALYIKSALTRQPHDSESADVRAETYPSGAGRQKDRSRCRADSGGGGGGGNGEQPKELQRTLRQR